MRARTCGARSRAIAIALCTLERMRSPLRFSLASASALALVLAAGTAAAATLQVGPGKTYDAPCAAIAAAKAGDTIEIDAAKTYSGDVCSWKTDALVIRGVGGRPKIDAGGKNAGGKGTWVVYAPNATIENVEMSGAKVTDKNGAAIRHQGQNLTVRGVYLHDNENGILGGPLDAAGASAPGTGSVVIERSEFAHNGAGDGYSHNLYIGEYGLFSITGSYTHDAVEGHLIKTRAHQNRILGNRIVDGAAGSPSYEIDVPQGGRTFVIGNVIVQNSTTHNPALVTFAEETGAPLNPGSVLFLVNNTLVNERSAGGTFVNVNARVTTPSVLRNDVFFGAGTVCNQASAIVAANQTTDPKFVSAATGDYHLADGSPCIDKGIAPGSDGADSLAPAIQYVDVADYEARVVAGVAIDIGAFEKGGGAPLGDAGPDAGGGDAGGGDAAIPVDGAVVDASGDAPVSTDGGADGGDAPAASDSSGCGCRVDGGAREPGLRVGAIAALLALAALARRRRD